MSDTIMLDMLGDTLRAAIVEARSRTSDDTIMCRIGEIPGGGGDAPPGFVPGLVSIHRDGHDTVYGLSEDGAVEALTALA
jgi:hypothetical protein